MLQSFKLAIKSIWSNKMRSFLTMLGIIIGVASVIILVSIVNAYMSYMTESFASMGTNQITVNLINLSSRSVSVDEMYEFFDENTDAFDHMTPMVSLSASVKNGNDTMDATSVSGVSEDYLKIKDYELTVGRNIQYADISGRSKVCVIGAYVANAIFGSAQEALSDTIKINGYAFTVVGVVSQQDDDEDQDDGCTDDFIWIPYTTASKMARNASISNYTFTIREISEASDDKELIEDFLYTKFKNEDLYTVTAMSEMLDSLNSMIAMVSAGLGGIAGISLLVAGVGVMNIMLVSVTERTREIGIRKALGAKRSVIMQQFVIEAAVTSSIGGLIGIGLGSLATNLVGQLAGLEATPTPAAVIVSFSVSVGIGLFFGYMPASKASKLNPIDALRSE
ncbi:MAG: ABC transporter permease [Clostridiales bacterium]|nr:ABC transporter permease [Clostridiales bacterium]